MQLTLEERLRQRLSEKRRSGRARVLKARELANATPQERARHYWGVMREAVLAMHQNAAGEGLDLSESNALDAFQQDVIDTMEKLCQD